MPLDHRGEGVLERPDVEVTAQAHAEDDVVEAIVRCQVLQEPQSFLGEGEGEARWGVGRRRLDLDPAGAEDRPTRRPCPQRHHASTGPGVGRG